MQILGIDFTSAPTRRKPITCAVCTLRGNVLSFDSLVDWASFEEFEAALSSPGPWVAGIDFPFGQARRFIENIGWPAEWCDYVAHAAALGRAGFRDALEAYRLPRQIGDKEHRRHFDVLARSISPQKLYGVPVALMFFEGARRVIASGAKVPGLMEGDPSRRIFESYPGVAARAFVGQRSYKSDDRRKQTDDQLQTRLDIFKALTGAYGFSKYGLKVLAPPELFEDASGDRLDALVCAAQAAWAYSNWPAIKTRLPTAVATEGWIGDPSLFISDEKALS